MTSVFDPLRLGAVALDVLTCGHATPDALAARQKARLAKLLDVAVRGSRFYSERLSGLPIDGTQLSALPSVSRSELMERFDDWVTDPQLKLAQLGAFIADPRRIGEAYHGKYLIWESSGTSHEPGIFVQDAQTLAVYDALEALRRSAPRPLQRWFDPMLLTERIAFVGATSGHFASMVSMQRVRQLNPWMAQSLRCFNILQAIPSLVEELNAFAPTVIATYPTVAALLADEACRGSLHFFPKELWTGGETLSPAVRRRVELALRCSVNNSYGASEFMSIGWECGYGKMHANTDWLILEPVDERGRPVPAGQRSYSTLLTNLANHVQPLIRYDLGDQVTVHDDRCACGSSLPVIEVQGRSDDSLVMAGRDGQRVTLLPLALTTVLEDDAGAFDFQLSQRDDHTLVLRLNLHDAQAATTMARCCTALENFATMQGVASISVIAESGQLIPRGRSGKAQRVVARPNPTRD
ncbi:phenylacetate--CoA ligase family protein [Rhodoferax ferrireducens]|uniref:phenylacetate--CoA ligase family protein n=1 Tax=Rhodoferax ferrireducens TaxID=192843 RepID=UPI000E0D34F6|nr:phenylacetate--CoA ligase family protein [Rhodoferax ferrireducens]